MAPPPGTYVPAAYQAQAQAMSIDEKVAMDVMSHMDRGPSLQAPVQQFRHKYFVTQSQGADLHPQTDPYRQVANQPLRQLEQHMDPYHTDNPMNSLSYLYNQ
jgi:hypothetical protein